jgi:CRISPR system Cascade subunit CasE
MTFQLMQLWPDPKTLASWATRHGLLSPDGDYGYAFHALLGTTFGELSPRPFRYLDLRQGLLAYTDADLGALRLNAGLAPPDISRALGLEHLAARPFPTAWRTGQRLGFEVRARPVVRTSGGRERDAFLHAIEGVAAPDKAAEHGNLVQRAATYAEWLARNLGRNDAARIVDARMDAFRLTRVLRKGARGANGRRRSTHTSGPDVVFKGQLQVGNPDAFRDLLARGVGRHRAFGFGMLLLRPASSC